MVWTPVAEPHRTTAITTFDRDGRLRYWVGHDHVLAFDFQTGRFLGVIVELRKLNGQAVLLLK